MTDVVTNADNEGQPVATPAPMPAPMEDPAPEPKATVTEATPTFDTTDWVFVRMPDGSVAPIHKSQIQDAGAFANSGPKPAVMPEKEAEFYLHLANGDVVRVKESERPATSGTNAPFGHYSKDDKTYLVIGCYEVETEDRKD